jgi:hypothetical protein
VSGIIDKFIAINVKLTWSLGKYRVLMCSHQKETVKLIVECRFGRGTEEKPVRFQLEGSHHMVEEVLDQWYGASDIFFKVRADDGNLYILRRETSTPEAAWHLESFRQLPGQS